MPRAMWKGAISFGLVSIPVSVYPATEEKSLRFNQLHAADGGRIRMKRVCSICGEEVSFEGIVKGYEYEKDRYVVLTDEEMDSIPVESSRAIDILQFVDLQEIDPILFKKSYYLVPDETGAKAYSLLREALSKDGKVGIAKVSFRDKEHLAALRFKEEAFVLETMFWPDEIRSTGALDLPEGAEAKVRTKELEMARSLVENLADKFRPESYTDAYRTALEELIEQKMRGEQRNAKRRRAEPKVIDLMEALKASVDQAKGEHKAPRRKPARKKNARRSAA